MRSRFFIPIVVIVLFSALWYGFNFDSQFGPESVEDSWVAKVEQSLITAGDYRTEYFSYITESGLPDNPKRRSDFLERLISMRLLSVEAERDGATESSFFRTEIERAEQKLLIEGYLHQKIYSEIIISEQDLTKMFARVNTRMSASHLYAPTREAAKLLQARLESGETFDALAEEIFSTASLRENGGSVGEFGFDEMDPAFEDAAFEMMPGQISGPVKTRQGYSIIRLDSRFENPILTESDFATRKTGLRRYVEVKKRNALKDELHSRILESASPTFVQSEVESLFNDISGQTELNTEARSDEVSREQVLITSDSGDFTVGEFFKFAAMTSEKQRESVTTIEKLQEFARGIFVRRELLKMASASGVSRSPEFATALRRQRNKLLYEVAWNRLESELHVSDDSVEAHLNRFPEEFETAEKARVREILLEDRASATEVRRSVTAENFSDLAKSQSVRPGAFTTGGDLGYVEREQLGVLAAQVFDAAIGEIIGPIEVGGRYAILRVEDKIQRRTATVDEAREKVAAQLKSYWIRVSVRERAAALRDEYSIETQPALLATLELYETPSEENR